VSGLSIVVLGIAGQMPFAGVAWQTLHYLEGLRRLGHDVHYVEDTGAWPYDVDRGTVTADPAYTVDYLGRVMVWAGLGERWAYVAGSGGRRVYGRTASQVAAVFGTADVLLNLSGATVLREAHRRVPVRIYLETDPVLPQIEIALGGRFTIEHLAAHTHHFTFGERIGTPGCEVPAVPFTYQPTRQPVVLEWWSPPGGGSPSPAPPFTTVANWRQTSKDVCWQGRRLTWSKDERFAAVIDLPRRTGERFELALASVDDAAVARLAAHGWRVVDAVALTKDLGSYRDYLWASAAEFTVAKTQNVALASGWFSDRSACYLAAGKPVVTEDTGFGTTIPAGRGLFAFRTRDDAVAAVAAVAGDYAGHARDAREIAHAYFRAEDVCARLLARAGIA
jgi:hypothetical protein